MKIERNEEVNLTYTMSYAEFVRMLHMGIDADNIPEDGSGVNVVTVILDRDIECVEIQLQTESETESEA